MRCKCLFVLPEQGLCLLVAVALVVHQSHGPDVAVAVVAHHRGTGLVGMVFHLHALLHVYPQGNLASVQRRLLYVTYGTMGTVLLHEGLLVGAVGQEVALEHGLCPFQFGHFRQYGFGLAYAPVLFQEHLSVWFHMQDGMPLLGAVACGKG